MTPRGTPNFEMSRCLYAAKHSPPLPPFSIERRGENEGGQCAPVAGYGGSQAEENGELRAAARRQGELAGCTTAAPSRLQALFLRRQSGMGMKAGNKRPV